MKDLYMYPAIFTVESDGITIEFPDLPGCLPCADNIDEALANAKEAMQLHLYEMEEYGDEIPEPTPYSATKLAENELLTIIKVWMPQFRETMANTQIAMSK